MRRTNLRRQDGFTLIELVVVMVIIAILVLVGLAFHYGARERSSDAAARANLRTAVPAIEAYHTDNDGYAGMTLAALRSAYSPGVNVTVAWAVQNDYCISSTLNGRTWWKQGPAGEITMTSC